MFYLHVIEGLSKRTVSRLCHISRSSVSRIANENRRPVMRPAARRGRPRKLTDRQRRHVLRCLTVLREQEGTFSVRRLMQYAGLSETDISIRTVTRFLNQESYFYLQARKKGLLTRKDLVTRVKFANNVQDEYPQNFWTDHVAFYLDGTGFAYKRILLDQARAPTARIWRKKCEGLRRCCTAKGRKEGTGGKVLKLIVAISHKTGVIVCEPYDKVSGNFFANFIAEHFDPMFIKAAKGEGRLFLLDGDPCQNSGMAKEAMLRVNATLFPIPPRSPDLNPIENFFHLVSKKLRDTALQKQISKETYDEFQQRAVDTIYSIPIQTINNLIESINRRIGDVVENNGSRLKY